MRFLTIWEILIRIDLNQAVKHIFKLRDCVPYSMGHNMQPPSEVSIRYSIFLTIKRSKTHCSKASRAFISGIGMGRVAVPVHDRLL